MSDAEQKSLPDLSTYDGYAKAIHDFSINQVRQTGRLLKSHYMTPDMAAKSLAMTMEGFINTVVQTRLKIYEASQLTHPVGSKTPESVGFIPTEGDLRTNLVNWLAYMLLYDEEGLDLTEKQLAERIIDRKLLPLFNIHLQAAVQIAELKKEIKIHDNYWHLQRTIQKQGIGPVALEYKEAAEKWLQQLTQGGE